VNNIENITQQYKSNLETGLNQAEVESKIKQYGFNEVPDKKDPLVLKFLSKFWGLTALMLELIILISWFLHKRLDAYIVLGLLFFNAIISFLQELNAAKAVDILKKKLQVNVKLLRDGKWQTVPGRELVPGDIVRIRKGDFAPADITIVQGDITIDQSALTGESIPLEKGAADLVYSGSIVTKGEATAIVTLTGNRTYFGKTVQLIKLARPKSHTDEIVSRVTKWLLVIVSVLLLIALIFSLSKGINLIEMLPLILVLLLSAIPVALSAMFTASMALGSIELANHGVIITRLNALDDAASMDILCVDKTGTLTMNQLTVAKLLPFRGFTENDVLLYSTLASNEANNDAIDVAFIKAAKEKKIMTSSYSQKKFIPFDPTNRKTEALIKTKNDEFLVVKGSLRTIAATCKLDEQTIMSLESDANELAKSGYRIIAVAMTRKEGTNLDFVGMTALYDAPRAGSQQIINQLKDMGISIKMLTGDAFPIAREIARRLNIGTNIIRAFEFNTAVKSNPAKAIESLEATPGFAEIYPEDKYNIVKALQSKGHIVGMTGDGVNDAPALKQAEVGIAVHNATDVAKSAASMVLTKEGLSNIIAPIIVGRQMFERINIWVINKIARTILKTCFIVFSFLMLNKFIISASAMLIMIFMTDFVKVALSTDNVIWHNRPAKWELGRLAFIGIVLGILMVIESLGMMFIGLNYFNLNDDQLITFCFELLLFFALFSIFVVRERRHFWSSFPSSILLFAIIADMILGVIVATVGILGLRTIPFYQSLIIISYALFFSLVVNDLIKFGMLKKFKLN